MKKYYPIILLQLVLMLQGNAAMAQLTKAPSVQPHRVFLAKGQSPAMQQPRRAFKQEASGLPGDTVFCERFESQEAFDRFSNFSSDPSGVSWNWHPGGHVESGAEYRGLASNKWLATPFVTFDKAYLYKLDIDLAELGAGWTGRIEVMSGREAKEESLTTTILPPLDITWEDYLTCSATFTTDDTGDYVVGLHNITGINLPGFVADNLVIERVALLAAPDSVVQCKVTTGPEATRRAVVSFTVPTRRVDGSSLTELTKIEVWRDLTLVKTFSQPTPGTQCEFIDDDIAEEGNYVYSIVAYNSEGRGIIRREHAFIGFDTPLPPADITLSDAGTQLRLTWNHPGPQGLNGGYVEPELKYNVYTIEGMYAYYWDRNITSTEYLIDFNPDTDDQRFVTFGASAHGNGGGSYIYASNELLVGRPYKLPFRETFTNGALTSLWWMAGESVVDVDVNSAFDNDRGALVFKPTTTVQETVIYTGKIATSKDDDFKLVFYHYGTPKRNMQIIVEGRGPDMKPVELATIDYNSLSGSAQWRKSVVSLKQFADQRFVCIGFHFRGDKAGNTLAVDNVNVGVFPQKDLSVSVKAENTVYKGIENTATVIVSNQGEADANYFNLEIAVDDKTIKDTTFTATLRAQDALQVTVPFVPSVTNAGKRVVVSASLVLPGDRDTENNYYGLPVNLAENSLPTVSNLTAQHDGNGVQLSWEKPAIKAETLSDGFEDYKAWSIQPIGPWTTFDADGENTYPVFAGTWFENQSAPLAFIVSNPESLALNQDQYGGFWPRVGKQCLMSIGCLNSSTMTDNWLVSPELSGESQTISMWLKSAYQSRLHSVEIRYSTASAGIDDFKTVARSIEQVPYTWTKYSITLPEGARYFALRDFGTNAFVLMADDFSYIPAPKKPLSYNIYVDGERAASADITDTTHTLATDNPDSHEYQVSVVYAEGESAVVSIGLTDGILLPPSSAGTAITEGAKVYDLQGQPADLSRPGVYIVRQNDGRTIRKVVVK